MIFDGNFRLTDSEDKLKPLGFDIIELIKRNEEGELNDGEKIVPLSLRHIKELNIRSRRHVIMALPSGGDCIYSFTDNEFEKYVCGGFIYEKEKLFFASNLINLSKDRDSYRQEPNCMKGNYYTNSTFKKIIEQFQEKETPLFRTINEVVYYDKKSFPNGKIPNLGKISYTEAFKILRTNNPN